MVAYGGIREELSSRTFIYIYIYYIHPHTPKISIPNVGFTGCSKVIGCSHTALTFSGDCRT